ncbi:hypothetical protein DMN91_008778, partial [Ooceraea biroi]
FGFSNWNFFQFVYVSNYRAASGIIFFLEVTWVITLFVQLCIRSETYWCTSKGLKGPQGTIVESESPWQDNAEKKWRGKASRQLPTRNEDTFCSRCWSNVLDVTRGWRRAVFYLPLSCILAWRPNKLWLSYVAAGLLAVLSLLHIASSALRRRGPCQLSTGIDSVGESLLNSRQENYDRFEEVLVRFLTLLH